MIVVQDPGNFSRNKMGSVKPACSVYIPAGRLNDLSGLTAIS